MFLPVDVTIEPGEHEVAIRFGSLTRWLKKRRPRGRWRSNLVAQQGLRWARTTLWGRASAYSGTAAPVGAWRPVTIVDDVLIEDLDIVCTPSGTVHISGRCAGGDGRPIADTNVTVTIGRQGAQIDTATFTSASDGTVSGSVAVTDPMPWWPNGYGDQPLYDVAITLGATTVGRRVGFRTVSADIPNHGGFGLSYNGTQIFCRGAVWIPPDPVGMHSDAADIRLVLGELARAGANMVRVPGGTVYEQPEFWDICAELGILVWQDAMLATFDPPEDIQTLIVRELETALRSVAGNPALAVVSGGSETMQQPEMVGLPRDARHIDLVERQLAKVAESANVPYVPSSPAAPIGSADLSIRPDTGVAHWFGVGGYMRPVTDVLTAGVRFAAESLAFSIPPSPDAVDRHFGSAAPAGHHPAWKSGVPRDKGASWDFEDVRDHYVREIFGVDPLQIRRIDPDRYLQLGRTAVIAAMSACFGYWRRSDSGCRGALVLTAKDIAPGAGWGLIDVDGAPKAPLLALRRCWSPIAVILADAGLSGIRVDVFNDSSALLCGHAVLRATNAGGQVVMEGSIDIEVAAYSALTLHDSEITGVFRDLAHAYKFGPAIAQAVQVEVVDVDGVIHGRDVLVIEHLPAPTRCELKACASRAPDGSWGLDILSENALRWVEIDTPGFRPADNYFHLAPGLAYRVPLEGGSPDVSPKGRVTSPDITSGTSIVVSHE
jgi:beta-mannosidase